MITSDQPDVDLVVLLGLSIIMSISNELDWFVYILFDWIIQAKSAQIDQIFLQNLAELFRFLWLRFHELLYFL
jgi:hypothetical protein